MSTKTDTRINLSCYELISISIELGNRIDRRWYNFIALHVLAVTIFFTGALDDRIEYLVVFSSLVFMGAMFISISTYFNSKLLTYALAEIAENLKKAEFLSSKARKLKRLGPVRINIVIHILAQLIITTVALFIGWSKDLRLINIFDQLIF